MLVHQDLIQNKIENKINFKENMNKNNMFTEEFLARVLSISLPRLHKTGTLLSNSGEIMVYGDKDLREYRLEDTYVILTKYTKKEQIKVLEQFKKEFFHG